MQERVAPNGIEEPLGVFWVLGRWGIQEKDGFGITWRLDGMHELVLYHAQVSRLFLVLLFLLLFAGRG